MSFVLMFALQCLFPLFDADAGGFTGVSIVNTDTESREFTVTATSADGATAQTGRLTLNAAGQRALLLTEILATAQVPAPGWVQIEPVASGCTSYITFGNGETLTGTEPARRIQQAPQNTEIILSHISVNTGFTELNHMDTQIAVVNAGVLAGDVTAQLFGLDGASRGSTAIRVPGRGSRVVRASEVFQTLLPANNLGGKTFYGYVRLSSPLSVAAWQRIETPLSRSLLRGKYPEEIAATNLATIPHFVTGPAYVSFLNILNPGPTPLALELTALDDRGRRLVDAVQVTLAPGESRRESVLGFFRVPVIAIFPPPTITGYIRIRESQGRTFQILGDIEIVTMSGGGITAAMLYPITDTASTIWRTPFAVNAGGYFTGYAIANPNELLAVQTDIQVEVVSPDGAVVSRSVVQLSPLEKRAALIPTGVSNGYLRFISNFAIHVMGSIGTNDVRMLDQLPAIRQ